MTWISLVCLLALSSSVFGRSVPFGGDNYGSPLIAEPTMPTIITRELPVQGYGGESRMISPPEIIPETRIQSGYGSSFVPKTLPVQGYGSSRMLDNYGSSNTRVLDNYGSSNTRVLDNYGSSNTRILEVVETQADILCRNQLGGTIIPIENNRGFVTCLEPGKGVEQYCPKNLWYHETSRRCERTLGPLVDPCSSQPCLNGGQCLSSDSSSWECRCAPGFDGTFCELDASHCQNNQPCGPGAICQSFRAGAALNHMCIFEGGRAYGLSPSLRENNPCKGLDGPQKLSYTDTGFMICDGDEMHIFACPGGTVWDDFNKACSWPTKATETVSYGYGSQLPLPSTPKVFTQSYGYGSQVTLPPPVPKVFTQSYGYGSQVPLPPPVPKVFTQSYGYGSQIIPQTPKALPKPVTSYGYGSKLVLPPPTRSFTGYGSDIIEPPRVLEPKTFSYGGDSRVFEPKTLSYGGDSRVFEPKDIKVSGY